MTWPAVPEIVYVFRSRIERWVDGDTVDMIVSLPFHLALGNPDKPARFRLLNVNAYEMRDKPRGAEAKAFSESLCPVGSRVIIRSHIPDVSDNFGRWLCEMWTPSGAYVTGELIENGHAVPYTA